LSKGLSVEVVPLPHCFILLRLNFIPLPLVFIPLLYFFVPLPPTLFKHFNLELVF
jgi:hypothetical protein